MISCLQKEIQVKSLDRVRKHGEVLTARREVEAMLDLVKDESERIDSRFLEPACGTGNFLTAILERKLKTAAKCFGRRTEDFEVQMLSAISSIYGIDLLEDNVIESQDRMLETALKCYKDVLRKIPDNEFKNAIRFILKKNILQGDTLNGTDKIIFTQWTLTGYQFKREEYTFEQIEQQAAMSETPLFGSLTGGNGAEMFVQTPIRSYPYTHYRKMFYSAPSRIGFSSVPIAGRKNALISGGKILQDNEEGIL